jgi:hypothetical protein
MIRLSCLAGNEVSVFENGANAVLIPNKLEIGAIYSRPITSQDWFNVNAILVKMVYRY